MQIILCGLIFLFAFQLLAYQAVFGNTILQLLFLFVRIIFHYLYYLCNVKEGMEHKKNKTQISLFSPSCSRRLVTSNFTKFLLHSLIKSLHSTYTFLLFVQSVQYVTTYNITSYEAWVHFRIRVRVQDSAIFEKVGSGCGN